MLRAGENRETWHVVRRHASVRLDVRVERPAATTARKNKPRAGESLERLVRRHYGRPRRLMSRSNACHQRAEVSGYSRNVFPTAEGTTAGPKADVSALIARQPVQCPAAMVFRLNARIESTVSGMIFSVLPDR